MDSPEQTRIIRGTINQFSELVADITLAETTGTWPVPNTNIRKGLLYAFVLMMNERNEIKLTDRSIRILAQAINKLRYV